MGAALPDAALWPRARGPAVWALSWPVIQGWLAAWGCLSLGLAVWSGREAMQG